MFSLAFNQFVVSITKSWKLTLVLGVGSAGSALVVPEQWQAPRPGSVVPLQLMLSEWEVHVSICDGPDGLLNMPQSVSSSDSQRSAAPSLVACA